MLAEVFHAFTATGEQVMERRLVLLIVTACLALPAAALPSVINIGALFDDDQEIAEIAFRSAVERVNADRSLMPATELRFFIERVTPHDSFHAGKKACQQLREGVAAIFGPQSLSSSRHIQSLCESVEVPHMVASWDQSPSPFAVNLHPDWRMLSRALVDLVREWKWEKMTLLYQDNSGLVRLQELLKTPTQSRFQVTVRQLEGDDWRPLLKEIKNKGDSHIVVDLHVSRVHQFLKQAQQVSMMTHYYHFLFTTLDLAVVELEDFKYGGTNITGFRLVDPGRPIVRQALDSWTMAEFKGLKSPMEREGIRRGVSIVVEAALLYDAVHLFSKALHDLDRSLTIEVEKLNCQRDQAWSHGLSLVNYMHTTELEGLTGVIRFDATGRRTDFIMDIIELSRRGLEKAGEWTPKGGINITQNYTELRQEREDQLRNKTLIVTTILEDPYVMMKPDWQKFTGNDVYEGYCIDMLEEISKIVGFNYTIKLVDDGKYGAPDANAQWNGMVRELIDRRADLAVASLTISFIREQVIDFTKPFLNLGISILFKRPQKKSPSLFSFLNPLSIDIWLYMIAAYLGVSFMLFVLARFSPYEWYNPHPCSKESDVVENQFTVLNSLWFTIGSLMQQGSDYNPRSMSTRLVSGGWWFFALIMMSSYTANLAAFLTVNRMVAPIEDVEDLSKQTKIKYGVMKDSATMMFFKDSTIPTYERMWNFMESQQPSVFVNTTKEGIERVKRGMYAFLLESTMNEYITQRDCDLMQVGGLLDSKGYGIGTPTDSPYRDLVSNAILKLQEDGVLQILYNKWWKQKYGGGKCDNVDDKKDSANELGLANVGGVFVVLLAGLGLSVIVAILEFVWKARQNADQDKQSVCTEMAEEFKFAIRCGGTSKRPDKKKRSRTPLNDTGVHLVPLTGLPRGTAVPFKDNMI